MQFQPYLVTLDYVRQHRRLATAEISDDPLIRSFIEDASIQFCQALRGRTPMPYRMTRVFDFKSARRLVLDEDLLAVTTFTNGDSTPIASSQYVLHPNNLYPKWRIDLRLNSSLSLTFNDTPEQALSVAGIWGYVPQYANAWKPITTLSAAITDTTSTSVTFASTALVQVGDYLQIDSETVFVDAKSGAIATVERGALGSTAATHLNAAPVQQFQQLRDIRMAVREMAVYFYLTKDKAGGRVTVYDGGTVVVEDMEPTVEETIKRHIKRSIVSI